LGRISASPHTFPECLQQSDGSSASLHLTTIHRDGDYWAAEYAGFITIPNTALGTHTVPVEAGHYWRKISDREIEYRFILRAQSAYYFVAAGYADISTLYRQ